MTITIPVTRILLMWVLCLVGCAIFGFTKDQAIIALVVSTLYTLFLRVTIQRKRPGQPP
jgi:hypothetical protein